MILCEIFVVSLITFFVTKGTIMLHVVRIFVEYSSIVERDINAMVLNDQQTSVSVSVIVVVNEVGLQRSW